MRNSRNESVLLLVGLAVLVLLTGNFFQGLIFAETADRFEHLEWFADAFDKIDKEFVTEMPPEELIEGAIHGMTGALDKYSAFLSAEHLKQLEEDTTGEYVGVGIRIFVEDKFITVDSTFPGSPAFREGILAGDKIISVDGKSTHEMSTRDARDLIRGPRGTTVELGIFRAAEDETGRGKRMKKTVLREKIDISSIDGAEIIAPGIGYLQIKDFSDQTMKDLRREIGRMMRQDITGLIIDLRWNPGGLLRSAVDVSDLFLTKGQVIVGTKGREDQQNREWTAQDPDRYPDLDLAIIINEFSASASEIVAGALHDTGRAKLFGTKTYGKGSVQTVIELKNSTALKLTTARYYTPNGTLIEESEGIEPDTSVPFNRDEQARLIEKIRIQDEGAMAKLAEKQHELNGVARYVEDNLADVVEKLYDDETTLESVRTWLSEESEKNGDGNGNIEDVQLNAALEWLQNPETVATVAVHNP